jgi:hypothetical protein
MDAVDEPGEDNATELFAGIEGRESVTFLMVSAHAELVTLNGQADFKASVVITASAVITSIAASQIDNDAFGFAAGVLVGFLLIALLAGVLTVYPKFRLHPEPGEQLPPHWNPLFFGSYARIPKARYLEEMARVIRTDDELLRTWAADLYDKGVQLVRGKYRFLRFGYAAFITAFFASMVTYAVASLVE